jgi:hypothetical protein
MNFSRILIIIFFTGLASPGCSTVKDAREKLRNIATSFNENVRWNRLQVASKSIPAKQRDDWLRHMHGLFSNVRIVDYTMTPVRVDAAKAVVDVVVAYYHVPDPTIRRQRRRQLWKLRNGTWMLMSERRIRNKTKSNIHNFMDFGGPKDRS